MGFEAIGQFNSCEEIATYPIDNDRQGNKTLRPGDIKYKDINGDGMVDKLDMVPLTHSTYPLLMYGLGAEIRYKNLTLGVLSLSRVAMIPLFKIPFWEKSPCAENRKSFPVST